MCTRCYNRLTSGPRSKEEDLGRRVGLLEEEMRMVIKRIQAIDPPRTERVVYCPDDVRKGDKVWVEERTFSATPKYTCAASTVSWDSAGYVKGDAWCTGTGDRPIIDTGSPTVSPSSMGSKRRSAKRRQEERERRTEEWRRTRVGDTPADMVDKTTFDIPDPMNEEGEDDE